MTTTRPRTLWYLLGGLFLALGTPAYLGLTRPGMAGYLLNTTILGAQCVPYFLAGALWLPQRSPPASTVGDVLSGVMLVAAALLYVPMITGLWPTGGDMVGLGFLLIAAGTIASVLLVSLLALIFLWRGKQGRKPRGSLALIGVFGAAVQHQQAGYEMEHQSQAAVPVEQEPRHHPVFHEGPIRILDVQIPPGDVTQYHTHDEAILYVPISIPPTDTQILGQEWLGVKPTDRSRFTGLVVATDTSYVTKPLTHRVKNLGDRLFRLIAITNNAAPAAGSPNPLPGNDVHSSSWFTAAQLALPSGQSSDWHTAVAALVVVQPGDGHARVEREGIKGPTMLDRPGAWAFIAKGARYRILNSGSDSATVVIVEPRR